ncbi:hypothetical protein RIEGSTA812A_PEG_760 [invertebrate metagenome]|uniref:Uncharacterized protein n=1 Tax=invertebrate metagenome TaxID=1711999 RepID=A0A484H5I5_9ZZZZ
MLRGGDSGPVGRPRLHKKVCALVVGDGQLLALDGMATLFGVT